MKDLFDAINTRVKEPYWGFFLLSFLAFNWRGLFLLFLASGTAQDRIALFDLQTNLWSLLVCPISMSLLIILITAWLKVCFGKITRIPYEILNTQELNREHKYISEKTKLEDSRAQAIANKEIKLIEKARRDEDIESINNQNVKENLKREIEEVRAEITPIEKEILQAASLDQNGQIIRRAVIGSRFIQAGDTVFGQNDSNLFLKYDHALKTLIMKNFIQEVGDRADMFSITTKGWNLISYLNFPAHRQISSSI